MKRYCETELAKEHPCAVGWGSADASGSKNCHLEPKERYCVNLVEKETQDKLSTKIQNLMKEAYDVDVYKYLNIAFLLQQQVDDSPRVSYGGIENLERELK